MSHLRLPGDVGWSVWRWAVLRGAGFPGRHVRRLATAELGRAVAALFDAERSVARARSDALDALRAATAALAQPAPASYRTAWRRVMKGRIADAPSPELHEVLATFARNKRAAAAARAELSREYGVASERTSEVVREIAAEPRFREAVTWQNRTAVRTGIDALLRHPPGGHDDRRQTELIASYYTRYCTKNDTIGFFGPVGWATLSESAEPVVIRPGPTLLSRRGTHFEQWGIDAVAETISKDPTLEPWIAPRRLPFVRIDGFEVQSPMGGDGRLSRELIALLRASDGATAARDIAAALVRDRVFASEREAFDALRELRERGLIAWQLELPLGWEPERELAALIARIADDPVRARAARPLEDLCRMRERVAAAAGDPVQLDDAIEALESTFTSITGKPPTRAAGATYATRTLIFEDTVRDVDAVIGGELLAELARPLSLLLTSVRWYTFEIAKRYAAAFAELHTTLAASTRDRRVSLVDFWLRATRLLFGTHRPLDAATAEFRDRWARVLRSDDSARRVRYASAELGGAVSDVFAAPGPGWIEARYHSPDIMIAANGVDAIQRGDYELVLGEVHVATCTIDTAFMVENHAAPHELYRAAALDMPEPRMLLAMPKDTLRMAVRTSRRLVDPKDHHVEIGRFLAKAERSRVLPIADLFVVERGDRLVVTDETGSIAVDIVDFYGDTLSVLSASSISSFATFTGADAAAHCPRITIDRLVLQRESWSVEAAQLAGPGHHEEQFLAIRRWAHDHGVSRHVFVKSPLEIKPTYHDLDSPVSVALLAKAARRANADGGQRRLTITEMLPDLDQLWLPDADGELYTAELRLVAVDPQPPRGNGA